MKTKIQFDPRKLTKLQKQTLSYLFRHGCSQVKKIMADINFDSKIQSRNVLGQLKGLGIISNDGVEVMLTKRGKEYVTFNSFIVNASFKG